MVMIKHFLLLTVAVGYVLPALAEDSKYGLDPLPIGIGAFWRCITNSSLNSIGESP